MNLDKHRLQRELLQPEAVAIKVSNTGTSGTEFVYHRLYWPSELRQVAVAAFDLYSRSRDYHTLAWILCGTNFPLLSTAVSKVRGWRLGLLPTYL